MQGDVKLGKDKNGNKEEARLKSALENSENSRNAKHGYMETGNPAEVHAKARAMRNNDNDSY